MTILPKKLTKLTCMTATIAAFALTPIATAHADILPPVSQDASETKVIEETHPAINLTLEKSELLHIEEEIGSIIIGSTSHMNILADSAHTIVVVPRKPGASHFTILDKKGKVLMQRHVIVAAPKEDYLRIKRVCRGDECENTSVYYCPDTCHDIDIPAQAEESSGGGSSQSSSSDSGSSEE